MPWAIGFGKPNSRALSACMWIGLRSPDTPRVAAADVVVDLPERVAASAAPTLLVGARRRRRRPRGAGRSTRLCQTGSPPAVASATRSNWSPRSCSRRLSARTVEVERLVGADRPRLLDPVLDVDEADHRERERAVGHQLHRERERDHVRVGRRQLVAQPEAAHVRRSGPGGRGRPRRRARRARRSGSCGSPPRPQAAAACAAARSPRRPARAGRAP